MRDNSNAVVRILLSGVGNVGRRFLELTLFKGRELSEAHRIEIILVGVADSGGAAVNPLGLDPRRVIDLKLRGLSVSVYPGFGRPGQTAGEMVEAAPADLFLEASPEVLRDGQPALGWIEAALARRMHVILANKAPLVHAYSRLVELADRHGVRLRFDATVAGGLPVVNLGQRDLAVTRIVRLEGLLNLTTSLILDRMASSGLDFASALAEARASGHAEADPRLDTEGWDAAMKLVILSNSVLRFPATLSDVTVEGITSLSREALVQAASEGARVKLLALAELLDGAYRLSVKPARLPAGHPLALLGPEQMGVVFHTDVCGVVSAAIVEATPMPTAYAMLRDIVETVRCEKGAM